MSNERLEAGMRSQVVKHGKGVWANEVFGKFNDRGLVGGLLDFSML